MTLCNILLGVFCATLSDPFLYCGEADEKRDIATQYVITIPQTNLTEHLKKFTEDASYKAVNPYTWSQEALVTCARLFEEYPSPQYCRSRLLMIRTVDHITSSDTSLSPGQREFYNVLMKHFALSCMNRVRPRVTPEEMRKDKTCHD